MGCALLVVLLKPAKRMGYPCSRLAMATNRGSLQEAASPELPWRKGTLERSEGNIGGWFEQPIGGGQAKTKGKRCHSIRRQTHIALGSRLKRVSTTLGLSFYWPTATPQIIRSGVVSCLVYPTIE